MRPGSVARPTSPSQSRYGRADFRLGSRGEVVFLEMNPLPTLAPTDPDLYAAAQCMGKTPSDLVARILASARAS
jgi:D-alanine-D-alanine ligase-like ATP-grasp enzyme